MKDSEVEEYLGSVKKRREKLILVLGIFLVILSILLASLASQEFHENKTISGSQLINKDKPFYLNLSNTSAYSRVYNGTLYINASSTVIVWNGDKAQVVNGTISLKMNDYSPIIRIEALYDNTRLSYRASYVLVIRPFLELSIISLFILVIGSVMSFMGLYYFLLYRRLS